MYELVAKGKIPHFRIEGKILVNEEDLDAYLRNCRVEAIGNFPSRPRSSFKQLNASRMAGAWRKRGVMPSP